MNQQDLVWVRLPFTNMGGSKIRPAVVVSNDRYNKIMHDAVVCAITSNIEERPFSIIINSDNLSGGKLPIRSKIRADKILQIDKSLIVESFARLNDNMFDLLIKEIVKLVSRGKS